MKLKFLAIALFPLTLAACQSSDIQKVGDLAVSMVQQQNADKTLAAYQWSYQPQGTDKPLVLNFNDQQRLSIATGCNTQGTSWKIEKGQIVTADLMSTMMACSPELMKQVIEVLNSIEDFTSLNIETILKEWMTSNEIGMGKVMQPLRLSLVGALKGPHLFDIIEMIGKAETVSRIEKAIHTL